MKTTFNKLATVLMAFCLSFGFTSQTSAQGIDITSISSGEWSNQANWDCDCLPSNEDNVTIATGTNIDVSQNIGVHHLTIEDTATLQLNQSLVAELSVSGNWSNQGDFIAETGKVLFIGTEEQEVSGTTNFYDLILENDHDVVLNGECNILHSLSISSANLVTNGNLTLAAVDGETASLLPINSGQLSGTISVQKIIDKGSVKGWNQFGIPFSDVTVEQLNDDLPTTGYPGSNYPDYDFVSTRSYLETTNDSPPTTSNYYVQDTDEIFEDGNGYYLYTLAGTHLVDFVGTAVTGEFSFPLSYTNYDNNTLDGLNMLSNPYPSAIDTRIDEGWSSENIAGVVYTWDAETETFKTYLNGYSLMGGSPVIRQCEAFWVKANNSSAMISINESAKTMETDTEVNTAQNFLHMNLTNGSMQDEFIVVFDTAAVSGYGATEDAFKMTSPRSEMTISTMTTDSLSFCINSLPVPDEGLEIPVAVTISDTGDYVLETKSFPQTIGNDRCLGIEDVVTGEYYLLTDTTAIEFSSVPVEQESRFKIHLGARIVPEVSDIACFGEGNGEINISGVGTGPFDYYLLNSGLQEVTSHTEVEGATTFTELTPGTYTVEVHNNEFCDVRSISVQITQPGEIGYHAILNHVQCYEDSTGIIDLLPVGGVPPYTFEWSNGVFTEDQENLPGGAYTVIITDSNGCTREATHNIFEPDDVVAQFTSESQTVDLIDGEAVVEFTNETIGATMFEWDFDDGSEISTEENPAHTFTETGFYIISLNANNSHCEDSYQAVINVQPGTGIEEIGEEGAIDLGKNNSGWFLSFDFESGKELEINVYNLLGQKIIAPLSGRYFNEHLNLGGLSEATVKLIEIRDMDTGKTTTYKVMH